MGKLIDPQSLGTYSFHQIQKTGHNHLPVIFFTDQLVSIIRRVARGEHPINESLTARPQIAEQVLQQFQELSWRSESEPFISPLTSRESEILDYIAQGYLNKQIAIALSISEQTIKNHVTSILRKLNANARTEAVVIAIKQGIISLN